VSLDQIKADHQRIDWQQSIQDRIGAGTDQTFQADRFLFGVLTQ